MKCHHQIIRLVEVLYGGSSTTDAVAVLDFGGDKTATAGTFTIQFPAFTTSAAILRLA